MQIDELNEKRIQIEKEKQLIYKKLFDYKRAIEKNYSFMIGKKAMCIKVHETRPVECICTSVIVLDDYKTVKPLFSRNDKKFITESYEWI